MRTGRAAPCARNGVRGPVRKEPECAGSGARKEQCTGSSVHEEQCARGAVCPRPLAQPCNQPSGSTPEVLRGAPGGRCNPRHAPRSNWYQSVPIGTNRYPHQSSLHLRTRFGCGPPTLRRDLEWWTGPTGGAPRTGRAPSAASAASVASVASAERCKHSEQRAQRAPSEASGAASVFTPPRESHGKSRAVIVGTRSSRGAVSWCDRGCHGPSRRPRQRERGRDRGERAPGLGHRRGHGHSRSRGGRG